MTTLQSLEIWTGQAICDSAIAYRGATEDELRAAKLHLKGSILLALESNAEC